MPNEEQRLAKYLKREMKVKKTSGVNHLEFEGHYAKLKHYRNMGETLREQLLRLKIITEKEVGKKPESLPKPPKEELPEKFDELIEHLNKKRDRLGLKKATDLPDINMLKRLHDQVGSRNLTVWWLKVHGAKTKKLKWEFSLTRERISKIHETTKTWLDRISKKG